MEDLLIRLNEINVELDGLGDENWELVVKAKLELERLKIMECLDMQ